MSDQSKVTTYYSRKRKIRDDSEPSAKRKRLDDRHVVVAEDVTLEPHVARRKSSKNTAASSTLDALFGDEPAVSSNLPEPAASCELFAPKVSYHGRARRNVGSVLSLTTPSRVKTISTDQEWCKPVDTAGKKSAVRTPTPTAASKKYAALAAPILAEGGSQPVVTSSKAAAQPVPSAVRTKGQSSFSSVTADPDQLPSSRLQRLATPFGDIAAPSSNLDKFVSSLPMPVSFKRLQEKMEATDNLLCLRRQFAGPLSQVKEGVQRMTRREYSEVDVARITAVMPPAFVLTQEKQAGGYELHLKLNTAWKEDLAAGRPASMSCQLPTGIKHVIQLKLERKEAFKDRLLAHVFDHHQKFLTELNIRAEKAKPLTHWHPRFKLDSLPAIPRADMPKPPDTLQCSSASEVLQMNTIKSEKVGRALQAVASSSAALQKQQSSTKLSSPKSTAPDKATLTPPPTPHQSDSKSKVASMKGVPTALLEKIRKREAEKAVLTMTCPVEREQEMQVLDKLPEICRVMCSVFISERRDVLELSVLVRGLRQSIPSLQACTTGQLEEYVSTLAGKLKQWVSIISPQSRQVRYVKLVASAKSQVAVLLAALAKCRTDFDAEIRSMMS